MSNKNVRIREYDNIDWESICHIHDKARLGELEGNVPLDAFIPLVDAAIRLYEKEGFVICKTKKGKLAGNEKFSAEGHIMVKY